MRSDVPLKFNAHPILAQQLEALPEELRNSTQLASFLELIGNTYAKYEREKELIEHKHRVSGMEFSEITRQFKESSERLSLATKAAKMGVWEWNSITGAVIWDDFMYEIFGVIDREAFGKLSTNWLKLITKESVGSINKALSNIGPQQKSVNVEVQFLRHSDAKKRDVVVTALISRDPKNSIHKLVGVCMDVTDVRTVEREKELLLANLIGQNKELEEFAFVISHRLRAHTSKLSSVVTVFNNPSADDGLKKLLIDEVKKEAELLDQTLKELIEVIGFNEKSDLLKCESANLLEAVTEALLPFREPLDKINAELTINIDDSINTAVIRNYFLSAFGQFISNSIKFKSSERPLKLIISAKSISDKIELLIKDNGIGIDLERHQEKIFGLYRKFHKDFEGKGIGLHFAKKQLELMRAKVSVQSELNKGTIFTLILNKN